MKLSIYASVSALALLTAAPALATPGDQTNLTQTGNANNAAIDQTGGVEGGRERHPDRRRTHANDQPVGRSERQPGFRRAIEQGGRHSDQQQCIGRLWIEGNDAISSRITLAATPIR